MTLKTGTIIFLFIVGSPFLFAQQHTPQQMFYKMFEAMKQVKSASFIIETTERVKNEELVSKIRIKMAEDPYRVYTYSISPNAGAEAIFIKGANKNEVFIHPNKFPYVNLNLSPENMLLRKNHHFTIAQVGFGYVRNILAGHFALDKNRFLNSLSLGPDKTFDKKSCYQLIIQSDNFKWIPYTVKKGESITSIANSHFLSDYMIMEYNKKKDYHDVKAGDVIQIPTEFCMRIVFYLDKKTMLPLAQYIYDDKGLFDKIEYHDFVLNPAFTDIDFSKDNKSYGF